MQWSTNAIQSKTSWCIVSVIHTTQSLPVHGYTHPLFKHARKIGFVIILIPSGYTPKHIFPHFGLTPYLDIVLRFGGVGVRRERFIGISMILMPCIDLVQAFPVGGGDVVEEIEALAVG